MRCRYLIATRRGPLAALNDASSHCLTVGTGGGNCGTCGLKGLYIASLDVGSPATMSSDGSRGMTPKEPTAFPQPLPPGPLSPGEYQQGSIGMSNPNQNP